MMMMMIFTSSLAKWTLSSPSSSLNMLSPFQCWSIFHADACRACFWPLVVSWFQAAHLIENRVSAESMKAVLGIRERYCWERVMMSVPQIGIQETRPCSQCGTWLCKGRRPVQLPWTNLALPRGECCRLQLYLGLRMVPVPGDSRLGKQSELQT